MSQRCGGRHCRAMTTTIHLSGPADVLAVLPYQLGFYPRDSLVAVSLRGSRVGLVQRIDLPPPEHVGDAVAAMMAPLRKDRPRSVLLIGFEEREGECRAMLDEMAAACVAEGVEVTDRFVVRGERWFAPDCHRRCCPAEGLPLPAPSEVPAVAEFVGRGICPLPDRRALAERLEASGPLMSSELSALADDWLALRRGATDPGVDEIDEYRATELDIWAQVLWAEDNAESIQARLPPKDLAMLAVSLTDVDLRDALIAWLCPGTLARELIDPMLLSQIRGTLGEQPWLEGRIRDIDQVIALQRIERRLCEICAALPDPWAVPVLTVLATFTWWRGDGALTRIALDRALGIDPCYRLAKLLERMVDLAIRPERASA
jgi:Domain of unknown function (DUF4192)